jgi:hypothetical protein
MIFVMPVLAIPVLVVGGWLLSAIGRPWLPQATWRSNYLSRRVWLRAKTMKQGGEKSQDLSTGRHDTKTLELKWPICRDGAYRTRTGDLLRAELRGGS